MASGNKWRGNEAVVTVDDADVDVGILQDVEISVEKEISELYGAGSRRRQDVQQTEIDVNVSAELMSWTMDGYETLIGTETTGTDQWIEDTSDVPTVDVKGEFTDVETSTTNTLTVKNVYFDSLPISGSRDDWVSLDIDGTGDQLIINQG